MITYAAMNTVGLFPMTLAASGSDSFSRSLATVMPPDWASLFQNYAHVREQTESSTLRTSLAVLESARDHILVQPQQSDAINFLLDSNLESLWKMTGLELSRLADVEYIVFASALTMVGNLTLFRGESGVSRQRVTTLFKATAGVLDHEAQDPDAHAADALFRGDSLMAHGLLNIVACLDLGHLLAKGLTGVRFSKRSQRNKDEGGAIRRMRLASGTIAPPCPERAWGAIPNLT